MDLNVQKIVITEFSKLSIRDKLVVYSKYLYGNDFKASSDDLFMLSNKSINKIYKTFIQNIKQQVNPLSPQDIKCRKRKEF